MIKLLFLTNMNIWFSYYIVTYKYIFTFFISMVIFEYFTWNNFFPWRNYFEVKIPKCENLSNFDFMIKQQSSFKINGIRQWCFYNTINVQLSYIFVCHWKILLLWILLKSIKKILSLSWLWQCSVMYFTQKRMLFFDQLYTWVCHDI